MPQTLEEVMKEKGLYEVDVTFPGLGTFKVTREKPVRLVSDNTRTKGEKR